MASRSEASNTDNMNDHHVPYHDPARESSRNVTASTLGPPGTYSHQAAKILLGDDVTLCLEDTITDIFNAVKSGYSRYGVCPIVNSTNGPVAETQECLGRFNIQQIRQQKLRIGHALLRKPNSQDLPVTRICSHEQALGQCRNYIAKRYPGVRVEAVNSTALASQIAAEDPSSIAISSILCAETYGLEILDTEIQDGEANETTFVLFSKGQGDAPDDSQM